MLCLLVKWSFTESLRWKWVREGTHCLIHISTPIILHAMSTCVCFQTFMDMTCYCSRITTPPDVQMLLISEKYWHTLSVWLTAQSRLHTPLCVNTLLFVWSLRGDLVILFWRAGADQLTRWLFWYLETAHKVLCSTSGIDLLYGL